ncbi:MAG: hypothetical protein A3E82_06225 [Gammaproteobacteria bacterium RIFCSPHIGHO2_12_FULL_38_11]|nr:MAG: hypothetical protein A3E82_06225 [Gammaproteobacteria bacterium RIFCSPHIGHO2_12_FULL_38_11]
MHEKLQAAEMKNDALAKYVMPFLFSETFLQNKMNVKSFTQWTFYVETAIYRVSDDTLCMPRRDKSPSLHINSDHPAR